MLLIISTKVTLRMLLVISTDGWKLNTTTEGVVEELSEMRDSPGQYSLLIKNEFSIQKFILQILDLYKGLLRTFSENN